MCYFVIICYIFYFMKYIINKMVICSYYLLLFLSQRKKTKSHKLPMLTWKNIYFFPYEMRLFSFRENSQCLILLAPSELGSVRIIYVVHLEYTQVSAIMWQMNEWLTQSLLVTQEPNISSIRTHLYLYYKGCYKNPRLPHCEYYSIKLFNNYSVSAMSHAG